MGSGFYSFEEASKRLGRSTRSLHDYVKKGLIKKRIENGLPVLDREDIDLMAVDIGTDAPSLNRRTFIQMQTRLNKMSDEMRAVKHALGLREALPLRPNQTTCDGLLSACKSYLYIDKREEFWTPVLVEQWVDLFERMDEETLSSFSKASNDPQAWVPFFKFCSEMADFCWGQDKKAPSLAWQAMAGRLETARKHLRGVIVVWVEMNKGFVSSALLEALGSPKETVLGRIAKAG